MRDGELHERTFASRAAYLKRNARGIAAGQPWFSDFGTDLSRGFRALKVWFTLMHYGTRRLGDAVRMNCEQAQTLAAAIDGSTAFERVAPVALSVVCFTCTLVPDADRDVFNDTLAVSIQESGVAVISTTSIRGRTVLRVNLTNHRTTASDLDLVLDALRAQAERLVLG